MAIEKVRDYFKKYGIESRIREFEVSSATVDLAAEAIGCQPDRIAKSLAFMVKDRPILVVVAGSVRVNGTKYKAEFGVKSKMIDIDMVEDLIGHRVGGVCPFAINEGVEVYLDRSLKRHTSVYPACGSSNSVIELSIGELEIYSNFIRWVDIGKDEYLDF